MSYWDNYDKATQEESGGGGIVAEVRVDIGYKVYAGGIAQADAFFAVASTDERDDVKAEATAFAQENNAARGAQWGIQLIARVAQALSQGKPATWPAGDRYFNTDAWTSACKEVVVHSLRENEIAPPWEGWARIGFKPDPYKVEMGEAGKTDTDQDGNPRYPQVAYVVRTFAGQEEAYGGVDVGGNVADIAFPAEDEGDIPEFLDASIWDAEGWETVKADVKEQSTAGKTPMQIVKYLMEGYEIKVTMRDVLGIIK